MSLNKHFRIPQDVETSSPDFRPILDDRLRRVGEEAEKAIASNLTIQTTHATRAAKVASKYAEGVMLVETDRSLLYIARDGAWKYLAGVMYEVLGKIPLANTLNKNDTGLLFYATDYQHLYRWTGTAWNYGPGDAGSGAIFWYTFPPNAGIWALCDGTGTTISLASGLTTAVTPPNLVAAYPKGAAAYTGTRVAVVIAGGAGSFEVDLLPYMRL